MALSCMHHSTLWFWRVPSAGVCRVLLLQCVSWRKTWVLTFSGYWCCAVTVQLAQSLKSEGFTFIAMHPGAWGSMTRPLTLTWVSGLPGAPAPC